MPGATQNGFDGRKLADLVGLLDSPVDAEKMAALYKITVLNKKHGNVPFYALLESDDYKTAIWEKFGGCAEPCGVGPSCPHGPESLRGYFERKHGGGNSAELIEERTLNEKLRQDYAQLEKETAALAGAFKRETEINKELRQQAAARPVAQAGGADDAAREYVGGLFAFGFLIGAAALLFVGACRLAAVVFGG
jgi:hypothetical protein